MSSCRAAHRRSPPHDLTQLQYLDLSGNRLAALPEAIGRLQQLQQLHLSGNQLAALPDATGHLKRLQRLFLHGNDELHIPPEILGPSAEEVLLKRATPATPADILQFYFTRTRGATRQLNEAKILVVGQGSVGKTSLVNKLVYNRSGF